MTSQPIDEIIHIIFTEEDVRGIVEDYNDNLEDGEAPITIEVALQRAHEWGKHITDTAMTLCNEQLASCVTLGTP